MARPIEETLSELGAMTPDEIAERFATCGVKGTPGNPFACPMAKYLMDAHPEYRLVIVTGYAIRVVGVDEPRDENGPTLTIPGSVWDFVVRLDQGAYPNLVRRRWTAEVAS
jgi:hypothetical protein